MNVKHIQGVLNSFFVKNILCLVHLFSIENIFYDKMVFGKAFLFACEQL